VIRVAGMEEDECPEDGDQNGEKEGKEPKPRKDGGDDTEQVTPLDDEVEMSNRRGVESGGCPVGDLPVIKACSQYPEGSKKTCTVMEINLNGVMVSDLIKDVQKADFKEQLEDIDYELTKFDHVEEIKETQEVNNSEEGTKQSKQQSISGHQSLGLNLNPNSAQKEGKIKVRGWVRRDRTISEPKEQNLSLLTKRMHRDEDDEDSEFEVSKKKVAKENKLITVAAGSQPRRQQ